MPRRKGRAAFLHQVCSLVYELVLIVCLASATPEPCREERPGYAGLSAMSCMTQGQMLAARWLSAHPALTLSRWRCEPPEARQMPI
jgi:hypothetical protein